MYVGTRDDGADGNAAVGDIQVKLVALPIVAVALAVALASPAALGVQFLDCLFGSLAKLLLQNVLLLGFRLRAFPGPAGFPPRDHFLLLVHGLLARLDGCGVPADMTHDAAVQIGAYQGAQRLLHEFLACMGCKFPAEGGLTRYGGEPADLPQRRIAEQAVAKRGDGGNLEKLLGQGRTDHRRLIIALASEQAFLAFACRHKFLYHLQHLDEHTMFGSHISFENLLDVERNSEYHLATAEDFCYAFHGPALLLIVCS